MDDGSSKIQEFLKDWTNTELSIGTIIDRCIREAGIACVPVVEELVEQLQQVDILHLDETHWYESRLRDINPWIYIAEVLALARQGIGPPPFPVGS